MNPTEVPDRVLIFDTTLRDGEQSPGISLNTQEKLEIAQQLARLGVDVIEAGFPITSPGDFEAVQAIARTVEGPVIAGLARTHVADIDAAWNAVKDAERPRIHTFISTSDIHIRHQLQTTREDVKGQARAAVTHAKQYVEDVEFSPMDATRADLEFTAEVCRIAIDEGATTINIPDTVGYTMPHEFTAYLEQLYGLIPELRNVVLSVHCHDDLGLAVANSFAGLLAGARQVECAINGIGERAGNASLEEIVMLLHTRAHDVGLRTGAVTREIARTSRLVSRLTGYPVQPNKAVVGRNAFAHESGIHQDGVLKERTTYEIMDATTVGLEANSIVLGKHSGRHALAAGAVRARLRALRPGPQHRVQAVQGDRGQEEARHRDGPRGAGHRRAARGDRRLPARVVRRRGLLAPSTARDGRGSHARRRGGGRLVHRRWSRRRDLPRDQRRDRHRRPPARVPRRRRHRRPGRARRDLRGARGAAASAGPGRASPPTSSRRRGAPTCARCQTRFGAAASPRPRWRARRRRRPSPRRSQRQPLVVPRGQHPATGLAIHEVGPHRAGGFHVRGDCLHRSTAAAQHE